MEFTSIKSIADVDKKTLLHLACRGHWMHWLKVVKCLVEKYHCDVAAIDKDGNTPLHVASHFGSEGAVKYLVSCSSCQPNAVNHGGHTALHVAVDKGHKIVVRLLLSSGRVDPTIRSEFGHTISELVEFRHRPQASEYEGSPIQMVEQFIKCMENNSNVQPPFAKYTHYCLVDILRNVFKNRDSITVKEMVVHIKRDTLPLPEEVPDIFSLLHELQSLTNFFSLSIDSGSAEDIVIAKTGHQTERGNFT